MFWQPPVDGHGAGHGPAGGTGHGAAGPIGTGHGAGGATGGRGTYSGGGALA